MIIFIDIYYVMWKKLKNGICNRFHVCVLISLVHFSMYLLKNEFVKRMEKVSGGSVILFGYNLSNDVVATVNYAKIHHRRQQQALLGLRWWAHNPVAEIRSINHCPSKMVFPLELSIEWRWTSGSILDFLYAIQSRCMST